MLFFCISFISFIFFWCVIAAWLTSIDNIWQKPVWMNYVSNWVIWLYENMCVCDWSKNKSVCKRKSVKLLNSFCLWEYFAYLKCLPTYRIHKTKCIYLYLTFRHKLHSAVLSGPKLIIGLHFYGHEGAQFFFFFKDNRSPGFDDCMDCIYKVVGSNPPR